jgi:hypothetical protein
LTYIHLDCTIITLIRGGVADRPEAPSFPAPEIGGLACAERAIGLRLLKSNCNAKEAHALTTRRLHEDTPDSTEAMAV